MVDTPGDAATLIGERTNPTTSPMTSPDHSRPHTPPLNNVQEDQNQVNVESAERDFRALERKYSIQQDDVGPEKSHSDLSNATRTGADVEKGTIKEVEDEGEGEDGPFNLREYLQSSNDASASAGIKHKHVGVTWENLEVTAPGGVGHKFYVGTVPDALISFFITPVLWILGFFTRFIPASKNKGPPPTRTILHPSNGVLKPGEMCLVLGCPGSGCTSFLKTIANERSAFIDVKGETLYAGISAQEMAKYYNGEVAYNEEDDRHIATLTVAQTLRFALSTKTPGPHGRLPGVSGKQFQEEVEDLLLKMLNISHTKQTLVGDEFVRGVSGGERKRVSIAEMMTTRARVQCWDNSTRGLDASTALDFAKSLRIMTDILGQTTFVSLYQAGEGIYKLFDKVMVLDEGRQVFFGNPQEARQYFENLGYKPLPRQSTADYLTGCTDPNERQFAPGRSLQDVPSTPEALEQAYRSSSTAHDLEIEREKYKIHMQTEKDDQEAFRNAVRDDKKKGVSKRSPYVIGFYGQVKALTIRQFQQRIQDKFQLYTSFGLAWALAFVIGGAYWDQPLTSNGAFTRGSVIFAALLTTCLDAFGEMPAQMLGRPILRKQTNFAMYRPSAIAVANTLADLPFSASRIFVFNLIVYFMSALNVNAGAFFTFHLLNYVAFLALQGLFRTLGLFCTNFDISFRIATLFIPNFVEYCGYILPVDSMKRWLFWIYYINPVSYAWQGLMENEFMRISLSCDGNYIVPRNGPGVTKYPDGVGPNQVCTLYGATPGSSTIDGENYLIGGYGIYVTDLWRRNFLVLVGFMLLFQITQIIALEFFPQYGYDFAINIFAKEDAELKKKNEALKQKKEAARALKEKNAVDTTAPLETEVKEFDHKKSFTWEALNYTVPVPGGTRMLLDQVYGYVKPGTLTALMGASGAGKTTCLDVLAQRKNIGVISGDLLVDGRPLSSDFARGTAYAEQMDVHEGNTTVREALRFSAYLRQPAEISESEKDAYVEEIIELLELQELTEAMVFSLSVEARKRLTIGVELASKPDLLLFLDEPTSGLDAQSAWNLVRFLRKLASQGQAILCTIHQPSSLLFESFDRLLLLERGGKTVYFGDIGSDSHILREYLTRYGAVCPEDTNPAEFMLDAIGAGIAPRIGDRDWNDVWLDSPEYQNTLKEIAEIKRKGLAKPEENKKVSTYATPFWYQLKVVSARTNKSLWRSKDYIFSRLFVCGAISFFVSLSFLQLGTSIRDLQFRVFAIFWVSILPAIVMFQIEPMFIMNRRIFIRESSSRIYSPYVFAIGQLFGEIPYSILVGIVYWVLMVFPMGFGQGAAGLNGTGFQLLVVIFMMIFGVTLGQLIGSISPSIQVAVLFNPFVGLVLATFAGVTIPYPTMISFWRSWLYELDPYTRTLAATLSTELHGLTITCKSDEFAVFSPPSGQTCAQWASDFVSVFGGYLDNGNDTSNCRYCQYAVGDEFYTPLNISYGLRWRDVFILFSYCIFNILATIVASRFLRYAKR